MAGKFFKKLLIFIQLYVFYMYVNVFNKLCNLEIEVIESKQRNYIPCTVIALSNRRSRIGGPPDTVD